MVEGFAFSESLVVMIDSVPSFETLSHTQVKT